MLIDLHAHSYLSKGCDLDPRKVLDRAASVGLDGVAFTETNTQDGCDELFDLGRRSPVKVFVGLELVTDKGQFLCFFPDPERAPEPVQLWGSNRERPWSAEECLPKVRSLGAAIVAARPYDRDFPGSPADGVLGLKLLSAVEGFNARVRPQANELALEAAETLQLPSVGGSDTRTSPDEVGLGATFFREPVRSQAELVQRLLGGTGFWAVAAGELPRLSRPGEAREKLKRGGKGKQRRRRRGG
ncbi:MAG: PHP domain-containing protein [Myxococcaceae bacterium]|nr:PHP domain-containing protein [Myxococcaceae bacterium]MCI0669174.1 PHP domain-containing protein [Myxococcaceae bacterium]